MTLQRYTGLKRTKPLPPRTVPFEGGRTPLARIPLGPVSSGRAKGAATKKGSSTGSLIARPPGEFTPKVKLLIRKRAGRGDIFEARCESCGAHLGEKAGEYSHRDARGMGGSRDPIVNGPAGGTLACGSGALRTGCHGACENRDAQMNAMGFWLKNGQDLLTTPIRLHGRNGGDQIFYLAADGRYLLEAPEGAAA
jgi:hypothetical protein